MVFFPMPPWFEGFSTPAILYPGKLVSLEENLFWTRGILSEQGRVSASRPRGYNQRLVGAQYTRLLFQPRGLKIKTKNIHSLTADSSLFLYGNFTRTPCLIIATVQASVANISNVARALQAHTMHVHVLTTRIRTGSFSCT